MTLRTLKSAIPLCQREKVLSMNMDVQGGHVHGFTWGAFTNEHGFTIAYLFAVYHVYQVGHQDALVPCVGWSTLHFSMSHMQFTSAFHHLTHAI